MAELRKFRRLSLLPLLAWLLMQLAATSVFAPSAHAALPEGSPALADLLSANSVIICTPRGLMVINLDADGEEIPESPTFLPGCEWCQPFSGTAAIAGPEQHGLKLPDNRLDTIKPARAQTAASQDRAEAFRSRAPPL